MQQLSFSLYNKELLEITETPLHLFGYHWGQKDYLPNFYSSRLILVNFVRFVSTGEKLILSCLAKITLPKSVARTN